MVQFEPAYTITKAHLCRSAVGRVAGLMTGVGGEEGHVQVGGFAQLQVRLLTQQVSPSY